MNTKQQNLGFFVIVLSLAISSCAPSPSFEPTVTPTATITPTATLMPTVTSTATETPTPIPHFVIEDTPFRFVGAFVSGWIWQDEYWSKTVIDDYIASAKASGISVFHLQSLVYERRVGDFREKELRKLDYFLDTAAKNGVYVIFPFVHGFQISMPDFDEAYYHPRGVEGLIKDEKLNQAFKHHIEVLLNRKNTVNGKLYREDPTIFGWEVIEDPIQNPINIPSGELPHVTIQEFHDWLEDIASYIKSVDSRHLVGVMTVSSVDLLTGAHEWTKMFDTPAIDFIEAEDTELPDLVRLNKPFFINTTNRYLGSEEEICKDYSKIAAGLRDSFSHDLAGGAEGVGLMFWVSDLHKEVPVDPCFSFTDSMEPIRVLLQETANMFNTPGYPFPPLDFVNVRQ